MKHKQLSPKYCISFVALVFMVLLGSFTIRAEEPLSPGSTGDRVRLLQNMLIGIAYYNQPADGVYGPQTEQAVKEFQEEHNLNPTGIADEQTLSLLFPEGMIIEERDPAVVLIDGYTKLQSLFLNISSDMTEQQVIDLGQKYGMFVYNSDPDSDFSFRFVYMSFLKSNRYESGTDAYYFDGSDSIEVVFDSISGEYKMSKVYYHFGQYAHDTKYSVEYSVKGNLVGNHYQVVHGYLAADPTATYETAQSALDAAIALYQ